MSLATRRRRLVPVRIAVAFCRLLGAASWEATELPLERARIGQSMRVVNCRVVAIVVATTACVHGSPHSTSPPPSPEPINAAFGPRSFSVGPTRLERARPLTIGLHADRRPIKVSVSPPRRVEVFPATGAGVVKPDASWPRSAGFRACRRLDQTGTATLPTTGESLHVHFALRPIAAKTRRPVRVRVDYVAQDSFVEVLPKVGGETTITFAPASTTVGAHRYLLPGYSDTRDVRATMLQNRSPIRGVVPCA